MNKRNTHGYWVMQVPVISTSHLTENDAAELMQTLPGEDFHDMPCVIGGSTALVYCADTEHLPDTAPSGLRKALEWGKREGFDWVRFDTDGDVIDGLEMH